MTTNKGWFVRVETALTIAARTMKDMTATVAIKNLEGMHATFLRQLVAVRRLATNDGSGGILRVYPGH